MTGQAGPRKPGRARRHTDIESITLLGMSARMSPLGLHKYAAEFLAASQALPAPAVPFSSVHGFLPCRAIELALKAFLSARGVTLRALSGGPFGHDLLQLLVEAEAQGIHDEVPLTEEQLTEIELAAAYYAEKVFEYPAPDEAIQGYPGRADWQRLQSAAELLVHHLEHHLEALCRQAY